MTALAIRYLMGFSVSSDMTRQRHEFPPHPGRVFMAMAAALFETQGSEGERRALEWLERNAEPPRISAPGFSERKPSHGRQPLETYVPVNDKTGGITSRIRQARSFPTVRLHKDKVFLIWEADAPEDIRTSLNQLCAKVTRIGHSSSLVQMWVEDEPHQMEINLTPDNLFSDRRMRIPESGTLRNLERTFASGERPRLTRWHGYRESNRQYETPILESVFDSQLIVFEKFEGRNLGLESTLQLTSALRNAAMKALTPNEPPEWLSGHRLDGSPSLEPHVAFFPLPFVDAPHADGHLLGLAMAIPRNLPQNDIRRLIGPLLFNQATGEERTVRLWRNDAWEWSLRRETRQRPPSALQIDTWTEPSRYWATVTPVVLHHYPKRNRGPQEVERILREAFVSARLPVPTKVIARSTSPFDGSLNAQAIPSFSEGGAELCRYQTHVIVEFEHKVRGPVLVGRGRYRGYGLFRPLRPRRGWSND